MIVSIGLTLEEAIKARLKRSEMITLDDIDRIDLEARELKSEYEKFIENYENKLGLKYDKWDKDLKEKIGNEFIEKYYENGELSV